MRLRLNRGFLTTEAASGDVVVDRWCRLVFIAERGLASHVQAVQSADRRTTACTNHVSDTRHDRTKSGTPACSLRRVS